MVKLIECPRDAMQGLEQFVPTSDKIAYLNQLLKVGFDTLDFGSFVSPKAIPQMRDTASVLEGLNLSDTSTSLLAIVANERGADDALQHSEIAYLGYPFSISETFQKRNTNRSIEDAVETLEGIQAKVTRNNKKLVAYLSMGFGNPYGDPYSPELVSRYTRLLKDMGIGIISLSDTVGSASASEISTLFESITDEFTDVEFGVHLHATAATARAKVSAAYDAGCRRFDGAIRGFGGCPMAENDLVGNVATEVILSVLNERNESLPINMDEFDNALHSSRAIF